MSHDHPLAKLETALLIAIGGFAGSNMRYFVGLIVPSSLITTMAVNVIGSFALGVLLYEAMYTGVFTEQATIVFGTGFLSSFTTYSGFALDVFTTSPAIALGYVGLSYVLGFIAIIIGKVIAQTLEVV